MSASATTTTDNNNVVKSNNNDHDLDLVPVVEKTKWPDSLPHPEAGFVLSVVCGNTSFRWALHEPAGDGFFPLVYWKANAPAAKSKKKKQGNGNTPAAAAAFDPPTVQTFFRKFFPDRAVRQMLEREGFVDEKEEALTHDEVQDRFLACFAVRRAPFLNIYVLSTNEAGLQDLKHLVSKLPVRIIQMQAHDFFAPHLHYPGMGADRLAALCAAEQLYGGPSLVIDGGTATTFTATAITEEQAEGSATEVAEDSTSAVWNTVRVRGGGIGPGIRSKFSVMHSQTSALPHIAASKVREYVDQLKSGEKQPLSVLDAPDTKQAMMGTIFRETAAHLQSVVATWVQETLASPTFTANREKVPSGRRVGMSGDQDTDEDDDNNKIRLCDQPVGEAGHKVNHNLTVAITGGDGDLFMNLLKPTEEGGEGGRILHPDTVLPTLPSPVNFVHHKYLIQFAISKVLTKQWQRFKGQTTGNELRNAVVGQRVVKRMTRRGRNILRGTVVSAHSTDFIYQITYDDGKRDEMNGEELYDALLLYADEGENAGDDDYDLEEKRRAKCTGASDASKLLEQCVPALVARMERKRAHEQEATCRYAASAAASAEESSLSKRARTNSSAPQPDDDQPAAAGAADAAAGPQAVAAAVAAVAEPQAAAVVEAAAVAEPQAAAVAADAAVAVEPQVAEAADDNNGPVPPPPPPILPPTQESLAENPWSYIGVRVAKDFDGTIHFGDVDQYDAENNFWNTVYDDGDREDYDENDMVVQYQVYLSNRAGDERAMAAGKN